MDDFAFDDAEVYVQARGTPSERLQRAAEAFSQIAQEDDQQAARTILAQLENKDAHDPSVRNSLDQRKVDIIAKGVSNIRRGGAIDLIMTAVAGALGVSLGYLSHKIADVRIGGVPLNAAVGGLGVGLGAVGGGQLYDSSLSVRNFFFTGGAMFSAGSVAYSLIHPEPAATQIAPGLNLNPGAGQGQP